MSRPSARPLRVLFAIQEGGGNGAAYSSLHLALGLAHRGVHVRFVCKPDSEVEALAREGGLEVHPFVFQRDRRANAAALAKLLVGHPADLASSQSSRDRNALTWLALTRRLPVPYTVTRRQMPHSSPLDVWLTGRLAARTIAVSRGVANALIRRGAPRRKVIVIPNGLIAARVDRPVDPADVRAWRERIGWTSDRPTLGIISRPKDQHVVLEALRRVRTPVRLVMAGVPP
ncbi:MAG TPA: glycosyltransferase, partial [Longimicrobiales bacterium]|nr:glycosyltransferase [Longimicrobiales bacterium]